MIERPLRLAADGLCAHLHPLAILHGTALMLFVLDAVRSAISFVFAVLSLGHGGCPRIVLLAVQRKNHEFH